MKAATPQKETSDRNISSSRKLNFASDACCQDFSKEPVENKRGDIDKECEESEIESNENGKDQEELHTLLPKVFGNLKKA